MSALSSKTSLFTRRISPGQAGLQKLKTKFFAVSCVLTLLTALSVNIPAQAARQSTNNTGTTAASSQTVFVGGILDFFNFLDFGSFFGSQETAQSVHGGSPFIESKSDPNNPGNLAYSHAPEAAPCGANGVTRTVPGQFPTIQAAINASSFSNRDTIQVAAGNYPEQVIVNKCINIVGNGQTGANATVILPPANNNLALSTVPGVNAASLVEVRSNATVTISNLTVSGPVVFPSGSDPSNPPAAYGVFVAENAALQMTDVTVTKIREQPLAGNQNGIAIRVGSVSSNQTGSLDFTRVTVSDYQKGGIIVSNTGSNAVIKDSLIMGVGATPAIGQNGVQISDGGTATITNSTIKDNLCDNASCGANPTSQTQSAGILPIAAGLVTLSGNTITNNDAGYLIAEGDPGIQQIVTGNTFSNNRYFGFYIDQSNTQVNGNFISGGNQGAVVLSYGGNTSNTVANFQNNSITGAAQSGIQLIDTNTSDAFTPQVTANFNRIAGNGGANLRGIDNTSTATVSADNNFWGCNGGPSGGASCDTAVGNVTVASYLKLSHTPPVVQPSVGAGGTTTITTNLRFNNLGADTYTPTTHLPNPIPATASSANSPNGIPVNFSVSAYGTVVSPKPLVDGLASTTFTGGTVDGGDQTAMITAAVDNASQTVSVVVLDAIAPTVAPSTGVLASPNMVNFTVNFSEAVTGVDASDFSVVSIAPGNVVASVTNVTGTGSTRTVQVTVTSGMGMIRLDVLNDGTIKDTASAQNPLSAGSTGIPVSVDVQMPTVTINQATTQPDPTSSSPINFTVVFSEPVTGFDGSDVDLSASTAGGTLVATVSGSGANYTVTVTGMTTSGTIIASIPANAAVDASNNGTAASTSTDNSVTYLQAIVTNINTGLTYPTIQAANDAPQTLNGHTIRASAGVYLERVNVTKSLTIQGAQFGNDARTGRIDPNLESTVGVSQPTVSDPPEGAFVIQSAVTVTIDGFRMVNIVRPDGDADAIFLSGGVGGHQVINNIFDGNQGAVFSDSPGNTFRRNRISTTTNTNATEGYFGGTDNTTIEENSFTGGYPNGAINTTGSTTPKNNFRIINNTFQATGNFVVLFATNGAQITGNTSGGTSSTTIFAGGGNANANVSGNTLNLLGGNGVLFYDAGFGYGNNSSITINGNTITRDVTTQTGNPSVFDLRGVAGSNTVSNNTATFSGTLPATLSSHVTRIRGSASGNFNIVGNFFNGGNLASTGVIQPSGLYLTSVQAADGTPATNVGTLPTSSVINANCNTFTDFGDGVTVFRNDTNVAGGLPVGIDVNINGNNFTSNSQFAINNGGTSEIIDGTNNYWNSPSGPSGAGPGSGDAVSANVTFTPFLTSPSTCAPVNNVPATQTINQDTTLTFSGANQISVTDLDAGNTPVTVTLSVTNGTLTLSQTTGLTVTGNGTANVMFSGTLAAVNAALNGLAFNPTAGFVGSSTLTITSSSTGSPGVGGGTQTDTDTVTINVLDAVAPTVLSINRGTPTTQNTNAATVVFNITFSESVTGVDATDFQFGGTIERAAATITVSADSGATRTVTVTGYTGDGTLGLNLVDNDSITDAQGNPLGGTGAGNGNFTGQTYNIDQTRPTVVITQAAGQADPTTVSPINFTVTFSESVAPTFDNTDVDTTASTAAIGSVVVTNPGNDGKTYNVQITPTSSGTIVINVGANVANDPSGNGNFASVNTDNSVTYFTTTTAMVVDDDGMADLNPNGTPNCDATTAAPNKIQTAINIANPGDTIYVCPGTYIEELTVNKQLTLLGPNANVNPNTGTRTAEAVINPTTSDPDYFTGPIMVSLKARKVIFNGFTLDGDNPLLTGGTNFNGANVDAAEGIDMPDNNFTGLSDPQETITNNIIKNIGDLGIALGANGSANSTNSTIQFNKIDNIPGVNYGGGVYVGNNAYTNITDNVITRISLGVVTENFYQPGLTGATIGNNQITANRIGIRHNLHYSYSTNGFTISNNKITSYIESSDPGATRFSGIRIESINGSVPATFSGNTINANRNVLLGNSPIAANLKSESSVFYNKQENRRVVAPKVAAPNLDAAAAAYTRIDGIFLTNTSTISPNIVITGNNITNALRGISQNTPAVPNVNCNYIANNDVGVYVGNDIQYDGTQSYATNGINLNNNNIVGNTTYGVQSDTTGISNPVVTNAQSNYWGAANGPGPVGPGSGDKVTTNVDFSNFLTAPTTCSPVVPPTVTINQVGPDPTNTQPINFNVVFSEAVTGFTSSDVILSGTAGNIGGATIVVTGSGTTYNVAVSGLTTDGTVTATIPVGAAQSVATGSPTSASTSTDNTVTLDTLAPTVTINQAAGQPDPTNVSPINFTVVFSEPTTNFATGDVTLSGTAGATTATVTGSGTTYNVAVSGIASSGTVIATIGAGVATDAAGNGNAASTSTDNMVTYDITAPTVTINQASGQADPTSVSPINFTVVFSEPVTGFATGDVTVSGGAFGVGSNPRAVVTQIAPNDGTTYNVAVSGMNQSGTVIATIAAGVAVDNVGNPNAASTSTDNTVTFNLVTTIVAVNPTNTDTPGITDWSGFNDVTNTLTPPSYVVGPATPPLGVGSARLNTTATGKYLFFSNYFNSAAALPLSQFTALKYSSYAIDPSNAVNLPTLQIGIDYDSADANTGFQGRIVFEPAENTTPPNQAPAQSQWQTWDATNGRFYFTQGPGTASCGISSPCPLATILATYPRINIPNTAFGFIGFRSTGGGANAVENYVDNFTIGINSANTTFNFEPTPPTISIGNATVTEGNTGTTAATFTITQSVVSQLDTTVTVNTADGTATTADNDYQPIINGTATITAGQLSTTVTVLVNGDTKVEGDEVFRVNLTNAVNAAIADPQGTGTINNDDVTVSFSSATYSIGEGGGTASISVCRSGVTPNTVGVSYATSDGTATAPADYTATSGTLSFLPNDTCKSFVVPIIDDNISEPPPSGETVNLTLSNPTGGATLGLAAAVLTIIDNDGGGLVTISGNIQMYNAPAANTNLQNVTVTLSGSASQTTMTDAGGNYSFTGLTAGGSYQVTPSGLSKIYDPIYRNYSSLNVNITNANFLAYNSINDVPRKVRVGFSTVLPGQQVSVPIKLESLGNENGVSFSLNYDTTRLSNPVATLGADAAGGNVITNTGTPGVIGIIVTEPSGQTFGAAGTKEIVKIQFNTAANTNPNTALTFSNSPIVRNVNDANANPRQSQFINGFVVFSQGLEADVEPSPNGDGDVDLGDFNQVGQYAANLASPGFMTSNEFQRADCEPTATKGDGDVDLGDFIQAGRYAAFLDPVQSVGGPAYPNPLPPGFKPIFETGKSSAVPRIVSAANVSGSPGNTVTVAIQIDAESADKGVSFTMDYDAAKLSNPQVSLGSGGSGGFLVPNTNMSGKVIVQLAYITGGFQAGVSQIILVQFTVANNASAGVTPLTFNDTPVQRQVRDTNNTLVASNFTNGSVTILGATAAGVSVGGKVQNTKGRGVANAQIIMTNNRGEMRVTRSNPYGFFAFTEVPAGETYTFNIRSKQYTFASQSVNVLQNLDSLVFTADK